MTAIINRTPTGRLISLYSELCYLKTRFGLAQFELKDLKYDANAKINPLMFFPFALKNESGFLYDPYLSNPMSAAKFHLTQSIQEDAQKSKSASECLNALEALGWVEKKGRLSRLTKKGVSIASIDYSDENMLPLLRSSVLGYGVFVGFLYKCLVQQDSKGIITKKSIEVGYKKTREALYVDGRDVPISTGSQEDTIIRTRSSLFAWAISTGFALPVGQGIPARRSNWHVVTLSEIRKKKWSWSRIKVFIDSNLFNGSHKVERPLSYQWMTKSTKALRERGQANIRRISLQVENKVRNRRFAIVYSLGLAAKSGVSVDYSKLVQELKKYPKLFVVDESKFISVMQIEKDIAIIAGIPYQESDNILTPLTKLNLDYLTQGVPEGLCEIIESIFKGL